MLQIVEDTRCTLEAVEAHHTRNDEHSPALDVSYSLQKPSCARNHKATADVMHLLATGIGIFCGDGIVDQCHQSVYLHLVIDVERVLEHQCLLLLLQALFVLQAGCLLASQFKAH
jgi:hypothetical protein